MANGRAEDDQDLQDDRQRDRRRQHFALARRDARPDEKGDEQHVRRDDQKCRMADRPSTSGVRNASPNRKKV